MAFEAKFPGVCAACGGKIKPPEEVFYEKKDELRHVTCPDDVVALVARPVCTRCFMEIAVSGDCGCP